MPKVKKTAVHAAAAETGEKSPLELKQAELKHWQDFAISQGHKLDEDNPYSKTIEHLESEVEELSK